MTNRKRKRYILRHVLTKMPDNLTPSERLIIMYLHAYQQTNGHGATQEQIQEATGVKERSFSRAWKTLNARNIIISEKLYSLTSEGHTIAAKLVS